MKEREEHPLRPPASEGPLVVSRREGNGAFFEPSDPTS